MAAMLASRGRFMVLLAGLLAITVYLVIALSWSQGFPTAQFAGSKSEQPTVQANDVATQVAEINGESTVDLPREGDVPTASPDSQDGQSNAVQAAVGAGENANGTISHTSTETEDASVRSIASPSNLLHNDTDHDVPETARIELAATEDDPVESDDPMESFVSPGNPLQKSIDPDVPGIASIVLAADFQSLLESGIDASVAIKYIDERVAEGKYGEEVIRK